MQGSLGGPEEQQRDMGGQDLQSMLEEMRDEREGNMDALCQQTKYIFVFLSELQGDASLNLLLSFFSFSSRCF